MTERPKTPPAITPEMIRLYDAFTHVHLDRRALIDGLTRLAGSSAAAAAILPWLAARADAAPLTAADDKRLDAHDAGWSGARGDVMRGYLVRPKAPAGALPGVLVIHENRGLNEHIRDVARRVALEGFVALAPDFLSPGGGTPADEDAARTAIASLAPARAVADAVSSIDWLRVQPGVMPKIGAIGFCWGGGMANRLAIAAGRKLDAAVAYYGPIPEDADLLRIRAALLLHYAGEDARINAGIPAYRAALTKAKVRHEIHVYPGVQHAFNNDSSAARYNKAAADLAWQRTIAFLRAQLK